MKLHYKVIFEKEAVDLIGPTIFLLGIVVQFQLLIMFHHIDGVRVIKELESSREGTGAFLSNSPKKIMEISINCTGRNTSFPEYVD